MDGMSYYVYKPYIILCLEYIVTVVTNAACDLIGHSEVSISHRDIQIFILRGLQVS